MNSKVWAPDFAWQFVWRFDYLLDSDCVTTYLILIIFEQFFDLKWEDLKVVQWLINTRHILQQTTPNSKLRFLPSLGIVDSMLEKNLILWRIKVIIAFVVASKFMSFAMWLKNVFDLWSKCQIGDKHSESWLTAIFKSQEEVIFVWWTFSPQSFGCFIHAFLKRVFYLPSIFIFRWNSLSINIFWCKKMQSWNTIILVFFIVLLLK